MWALTCLKVRNSGVDAPVLAAGQDRSVVRDAGRYRVTIKAGSVVGILVCLKYCCDFYF